MVVRLKTDNALHRSTVYVSRLLGKRKV